MTVSLLPSAPEDDHHGATFLDWSGFLL